MIRIIYWSGTGNTEAMANLIEQGIKEEGKEVEVKRVGDVTPDDIATSDVMILGCPSMGAEELEDSEMEPFVESLADKVQDKKIALFGSYDWGDGDWMEEWKERMLGYNAKVILEPLIVHLLPEGEDEQNCIEYGKSIAKSI